MRDGSFVFRGAGGLHLMRTRKRQFQTKEAPMAQQQLTGKRVAIVVTDAF
jgi:hypothetical protein